MKIEITDEKYTNNLVRKFPNKVFVFGDNLKRFGKGGQAIIRDEPNTFGIPTKRYPSKDNWAYFSDKEDERLAVISSLRKLYVLGQKNIIVFPSGGIGTGLAMMEQKSPKIFNEMNSILLKYFKFDNN